MVPADRQRAGLVDADRRRSGASSSARARSPSAHRADAGRAGQRVSPAPPVPCRDPATLPPPAPAPHRAAVGHGHRELAAAAVDAAGHARAPGGPARRGRVPATADDAVRLAVAAQVRAGVDVVTDGEQRRDSYASFVGGRLDNCQLVPLTDLLPLVDDPEQVRRGAAGPRRAGRRGPPPGGLRPHRAQPAAGGPRARVRPQADRHGR